MFWYILYLISLKMMYPYSTPNYIIVRHIHKSLVPCLHSTCTPIGMLVEGWE